MMAFDELATMQKVNWITRHHRERNAANYIQGNRRRIDYPNVTLIPDLLPPNAAITFRHILTNANRKVDSESRPNNDVRCLHGPL